MIFQYLLKVYALFFKFLSSVFQRAEDFYFDEVQFISIFMSHIFGGKSKKSSLNPSSQKFPLYSWNFIFHIYIYNPF